MNTSLTPWSKYFSALGSIKDSSVSNLNEKTGTPCAQSDVRVAITFPTLTKSKVSALEAEFESIFCAAGFAHLKSDTAAAEPGFNKNAKLFF